MPATTTTTVAKRAAEGNEAKPATTYGEGKLHRSEVERYSRQMLLPEVGSAGTRALLDAKVLVVGAGGLGSTISMYLSAAGVGHITLVDFDAVDRSNLHRQVVHPDSRVGVNKAVSAKATCLGINPSIRIDAVEVMFGAANGLALAAAADVVVDASDNVAARYLINDACVLAGKPLVSGSAMRWEGQLTVYNYNGGPCYRCMFPDPPPVATLGGCSDSGVIGAIPGAIGCLQALEVQKILMPGAAAAGGVMSGRMLFFDGLRGSYRVMKMRPRQPGCRGCGSPADPADKITCLASFAPEYGAGACGRVLNDLPPEQRMSAADAWAAVSPAAAQEKEAEPSALMLLDVREATQFGMCALPGAVNVPLSRLKMAADPAAEVALAVGGRDVAPAGPILVCCRRGNASVEAVKLLRPASTSGAGEASASAAASRRFVNVDGGLAAISSLPGVEFPCY